MLRSGRTYRKVSSTMSDEREGTSEATGRGPAATGGMAELLQMLLEDCRARERENEQQMQVMREHMDSLVRLVEISRRTVEPTTAVTTPTPSKPDVRPSKLTDSDDIEAYLLTFERMMLAYGVEKAHWVVRLAPQLSGKAQQAYVAMPTAEAVQYDQVKAAILRRYDINAETYRQRFRSANGLEL